MKTIYKSICAICLVSGFMSCSDFLEEQKPQATLTQDEVKDPKYIDDVLHSRHERIVLAVEL